MNQFDKIIKIAFRGDPDEDYYVSFPMAKLSDNEGHRLSANCWNMKVWVQWHLVIGVC